MTQDAPKRAPVARKTPFEYYRDCYLGELPQKTHVTEVARLHVESQRVNAADCLAGGGWDGKPLPAPVPNGTYVVELCELVGENGAPSRNAFARLRVGAREEATSTTLKKLGVDAGVACFSTPEGEDHAEAEILKLPMKSLKSGALVARGAGHGLVYFSSNGDGGFDVWKTQSADGALQSLVIDFGELGGPED